MSLERSTSSALTGATSDSSVATSDAAAALYTLLEKVCRAGLPAPSLKDLCAALRRGEHGVRVALAQLVAAGLVEAAGTKERRRWRLPALGLITAERPPASLPYRRGHQKGSVATPSMSRPDAKVEIRDGVRVTVCPPLWAEGALHFRPWRPL